MKWKNRKILFNCTTIYDSENSHIIMSDYQEKTCQRIQGTHTYISEISDKLFNIIWNNNLSVNVVFEKEVYIISAIILFFYHSNVMNYSQNN